MPNYRRRRVPGACIFFTVTLQRRGSDLLVREIENLRQAVHETRSERWFGIDGWVVLPDHMHFIWRLPEGDTDYSTRVAAIKARFSMAVRRVGLTPPLAPEGGVKPFKDRLNPYNGGVNPYNGGVNPALRKGQVGIWQKRFWEHHIRDERDWLAHRHYCWMNPVKHGLVDEPEDWPYSSYLLDIAP